MRPDLERLRASCLFCDPARHGQVGQVLLTSDNFYIFAGLGAIIEGYLIITPYVCKMNGGTATSIAELSLDLLDELAFLRSLISAFYLETYGHPGLSFEHGRAGGCAQSHDDTKHCYHPHLCCYPGTLKEGTGYRDHKGDLVYLWDHFALPNRRICSGIHTIQAVAGTLPYLYIEHYTVDSDGSAAGLPSESRTFIAPDGYVLDTQFLRRRLAELVGDEAKWDWAANPTVDRVGNVCRDFSKWLGVRGADYGIESLKNEPPHLGFESSVAQTTRQAYEKLATRFKARWKGTLQYSTIGQFLSQLPSDLGGGTGGTIRLLDVGCGPGLYSKVFADLGFECTAVDSSNRMLQEAERYLADSMRDHTVVLHQAQVEDLSSTVQGTFDAIWFSAVLLHVPRRTASRVLRALNELLSEHGVLYVSTRLVCDDNGHDFPALEIRREGRVFVYYQQSEVEKLFTEASFRIVKCWTGRTSVGTLGERKDKPWCHYLLSRSRNLS